MAYIWKNECAKIKMHKQAIPVKLSNFDATDINTYHTMGRFNRQETDDIFLILPRQQDLTLHANCLLGCLENRIWHFMQTVSQGDMKCQILFSRKNISKCCLLKFLPSMQSVNPCPAEPQYALPLQTV